MTLPNGHRAYVDLRKLAEYSLSLEHPIGGHKAALFEQILGLTVEDAGPLREILLYVAAMVPAALGRLDDYGQRYTVDFTLHTDTGAAVVRSAWIIRAEEDYPRLTTCFLLPVTGHGP